MSAEDLIVAVLAIIALALCVWAVLVIIGVVALGMQL